MTDTAEIRTIPIANIDILNPRARNRKVFDELVESIASVGLKRPVTVRQIPRSKRYELVCGQGRMEAFQQLGQSTIPAMVVAVDREDCFVMSLVENMARRDMSPLELVREIGAIRDRGYNHTELGKKLGFSSEYISLICMLLDKGEDRLLDAVERKIIPPTIAIEIARANDHEVQRALTEAYETKALPGDQVVAIRRIVEERNQLGKGIQGLRSASRAASRKPTAASLVRAYQKEVDRQKALVKKASLTQGRLLFIVNALKKLLEEEHFVTLLRAEAMATLPLPLAERLGMTDG
ncbi:ParB family chromosome partitioning protein [Sphingobium sp. OAS761]|uniref:plasmid partitioning protein RepB C-terminal domain-containing protein n=1 Tax=Sphingobium sp. OAS761 TaxID=2817901 RepID=UPI00209D095E|nr:plasmid partitioning protein RepB C-terminal domain-containing protein [Sphingobium sp. OAS761]MCP1469658.1 ParB family chromosome partitioning protein [Sphingobium sp. OAS761]